jgi:hypothetical protein
MSKNGARLNPLALRRRLLVAESNLNRAHAAGDMADLTSGFRAVTERSKSFTSIASSVATVVAGLAAFRGSSVNPSGRQTILKSAGLVSTLWLAFHSQARDSRD